MADSKQSLIKALKMGGIFVAIVGIMMIGRWYLFPGQSESYAASGSGGAAAVAVIKDGVQEVAIDLKSSSYGPIVVQKGIPVKFNIRAEKDAINGCNGTVIIPDYNVQVALKPGDNILEFTPDKTGAIPYSCWMGMVTSSIQVVEDVSTVDASAIAVPVGGRLKMPCCQ